MTNIINSDYKVESIMKLISLIIIILIIGCESIIEIENNTYICITFDDQYESVYYNALPIMQEYGFKATNVINTGFIGEEGNLSWQQVVELEFVYGWETAGHTLHHICFTSYDLATIEYEIYQDWLNLQNHGLSHETFALPAGHATEEHFSIILNYYKNIRTSRDLKLYNPINRTFLGYSSYDSNYTYEDTIARIVTGVENKESLIILGFHMVAYDSGGFTANCHPEDFSKIMEFIHNNNFEVLTIKEAMDLLAY